ncbi:MAG TPA: prolyl oligopeptidase family serine peptidase [Vicinamibacterales bacterium]|nr:prolyl oligopeptidase family serine peptidase [Vicinamibacterales bacterium]
MRRFTIAVVVGCSSITLTGAQAPPAAAPFTVEQILSLPTPDNLIASPMGSTIAWTFDERGVRNIYAADGPDFVPRKITNNKDDDGQELTNLSFSSDGKTIVYVRGGDHGGSRPGDPPNPTAEPTAPKMQVWAVASTGGSAPTLLGDGDRPIISPDSTRVAFTRDRKIFVVPIDGSKPPEGSAGPLIALRGASESPVWAPDGKTLAFVSNRGDHSFIALYSSGRPIRYINPKTTHDEDPVWSLDGKKIAFVRTPGTGGAPRSPLEEPQQSWSIMVADVATPDDPVTVATSGEPIDQIARSPVGLDVRWAADDTLVFFSYRDGWQHLYAIRHPGKTGDDASKPALLTPGNFMVEHVTLTPDRRAIVYNANTGSDDGDVDRRHLFKVSLEAPNAKPVAITTGAGIEWGPVVTGDGKTIAFVSADAKRPPVPAVAPIGGGMPRLVAADHIRQDFPTEQLIVPQAVVFNASDGAEVHGQLFRAANRRTRGPAIVYVHGGGPRQMLLGWHYRWEYANDYAINQYFASRGFIVLSVNYRLSVGYGAAYEFPEHAGARGASEYRDIQAAGLYLQRRPDVDPRSIGIWGASYGGYLAALGLGRDADVFAAGVDLHGVHDRLPAVSPSTLAHAIVGDGITEDQLKEALDVEFKSSPISTIDTWRSPVLFVHGDDDRTVDFRQTIELRSRLVAKGVKVEDLVLPDEVHDSLLWRSWVKTASAAGDFFDETLKAKR